MCHPIRGWSSAPKRPAPRLAAFIKATKKQLLIYDEQVSDNAMQKLLQDRIKAGAQIRIIGNSRRALTASLTRKLPGLRLHVRAMIRDGCAAFVGSQSLRKLELDARREVGVLIQRREARAPDAVDLRILTGKRRAGKPDATSAA